GVADLLVVGENTGLAFQGLQHFLSALHLLQIVSREGVRVLLELVYLADVVAQKMLHGLDEPAPDSLLFAAAPAGVLPEAVRLAGIDSLLDDFADLVVIAVIPKGVVHLR